MVDSDTQHLYMWIAGGALGGFVSYITLMIRSDGQKMKIDLMEKSDQNKKEIRADIAAVAARADLLKDDFNDKHLENSTIMVGHIAEDRVRDAANSRTFQRIDDNINEIRKKVG